jgi:hypothetical protein
VTVNTQPGCAWAATSAASWISSSASGSGSGTLAYSVSANAETASRTGAIRVADQAFTVTQAADTIAGTNVLANPGFEAGSSGWQQSSTTGFSIIYTNGTNAHAGNGYAWLGGTVSSTDNLYQDVAIPANASQVQLRFWYRIATQEQLASDFDVLTITVESTSGTRLATLATFSNADASGSYQRAGPYDLSAYKGQAIRLHLTATNDFSNATSFYIDDVSLSVVTGTSAPNYTALWWGGQAESGWGINVNHQGDILFATLFDYDTSGNPMWWFMSDGRKQADGSYLGALYAAHDAPAFDAQPFTPITPANLTTVGSMRLRYTNGTTGTLTYTIDGRTVVKTIARQVFSSPVPACSG